MQASDLLELIEGAQELRPVVTKAIEELEHYGPALAALMTKMALAVTDARAACIYRLESKGFTRQEAIDITSDEAAQLKMLVRRGTNVSGSSNKN